MTKIAEILFPKKEGFVAKKKPSILILSSPYDVASAAVRYRNVLDVTTDRGYTCLNKRPICFFDVEFAKATKPSQSKKKELTIWLEAHGAHGWLFGEEPSPDIEMARTIDFADYIRAIESHTSLTVSNIILSCCYSANEFLNSKTNHHYFSPARLLSLLLPNTNVMGFVGQNASAKGTSLYELNKGIFVPKVAPLEQIAILFRAGRTLELSSSNLYCDVVSMPTFIRDACGVKNRQYNSFEATRALDKLIESPSYRERDEDKCYGTFQIEAVSIALLARDLDETLTGSAEAASVAETFPSRCGDDFGYGSDDEFDDELKRIFPEAPTLIEKTTASELSTLSTGSAAGEPPRDRASSGYLSRSPSASFFNSHFGLSSPLTRAGTPARDASSPSGPTTTEALKKK